MKSRILLLALAAIMLFALTACDGGQTDATQAPTQEPTQEPTQATFLFKPNYPFSNKRNIPVI